MTLTLTTAFEVLTKERDALVRATYGEHSVFLTEATTTNTLRNALWVELHVATNTLLNLPLERVPIYNRSVSYDTFQQTTTRYPKTFILPTVLNEPLPVVGDVIRFIYPDHANQKYQTKLLELVDCSIAHIEAGYAALTLQELTTDDFTDEWEDELIEYKGFSIQEVTAIGRNRLNLTDDWFCATLDAERFPYMEYEMRKKDEEGNWTNQSIEDVFHSNDY